MFHENPTTNSSCVSGQFCSCTIKGKIVYNRTSRGLSIGNCVKSEIKKSNNLEGKF